MSAIYNFSPGPSMLPRVVLERIRDELFDWRNLGVSVMELSHRSSAFESLLNNLQDKLCKLMGIPSNYKILFLAGGAQTLFATIPMNFCGNNKNVDYFSTGVWSERAVNYAKNYADVNVVARAHSGFIPDVKDWNLNPNACYVYYCPNETVSGLQFDCIPSIGDGIPLIADMTSSIASGVIDVNNFGMIFASAQKNLGIAGISLVIIREDLLDQAITPITPMFSFKEQYLQNSCVNTIPVFPVYVMDLMVDWIFEQGGLENIEQRNLQKAKLLYDFIDNSNFYVNSISPRNRSTLNVTFDLLDNSLLHNFLKQASDAGLKFLKGHSLVGGARASIYNAMPLDGVKELISFMDNFAYINKDILCVTK